MQHPTYACLKINGYYKSKKKKIWRLIRLMHVNRNLWFVLHQWHIRLSYILLFHSNYILTHFNCTSNLKTLKSSQTPGNRKLTENLPWTLDHLLTLTLICQELSHLTSLKFFRLLLLLKHTLSIFTGPPSPARANTGVFGPSVPGLGNFHDSVVVSPDILKTAYGKTLTITPTSGLWRTSTENHLDQESSSV